MHQCNLYKFRDLDLNVTYWKGRVVVNIIELSCDLQSRITQVQESDSKVRKMVGRLEISIAIDGVILYDGRICILDDFEVKRLILEEAHNSGFSIHRGSTKIASKADKIALVIINPVVEMRAYHHGFVGGLPRTQGEYDSIWVIMDCLTKSAYSIPVKTTYKTPQYAKLFILEIMKLHGVPVNIVSDRDTRFPLNFWKAFKKVLGIECEQKLEAKILEVE
ncbi:retrotransposon-related protein [Trifolium pratense]|uniref:Retrotransposon-related protein n=1 Tax=Trifolium pratense TaxID=57577 RepID=A0A2K3L740_TRIPR|nr:retrotransposon-related protein [Trifolium pratense]